MQTKYTCPGECTICTRLSLICYKLTVTISLVYVTFFFFQGNCFALPARDSGKNCSDKKQEGKRGNKIQVFPLEFSHLLLRFFYDVDWKLKYFVIGTAPGPRHSKQPKNFEKYFTRGKEIKRTYIQTETENRYIKKYPKI